MPYVDMLKSEEYMIVDLDSGTVLGTNIMLVSVKTAKEHFGPDIVEEMCDNDETAFTAAKTIGSRLATSLFWSAN